MLEEPIITTRVVLTEKAPFLVDVFNGIGEYYGVYLVRTCVSVDELIYIGLKRNEINYINLSDYYIIMRGNRRLVLVPKTDCKRVNKQC